jgi:hypothetical protein
MKHHHRWVLPFAAAALWVPAFAQGCGSSDGGGIASGACDKGTAAKVEAFAGAVDRLNNLSAKLSTDVGKACAAIATDLGKMPPAIGTPDSAGFADRINQACTMAQAAIDAEVKAGVSIGVVLVGGECSIDAKAQFDCEANCAVNGTCDPGTIEARCEPAQLSGQCGATCTGSCTVTTGSVDCAGECSGTCNGMCEGTCVATGKSGACNGACKGKCSGGCTGTCAVVAPTAKCAGSCKGGCSVKYTAPKCEGVLKAPSCNIDADCEAGCNAQAQFNATCSPPVIDVEVTGMANAKLAATLKTNLPAIVLAAIHEGADVANAALDVVQKGGPAFAAGFANVVCAVQYGLTVAGNAQITLTASANLTTSVDASGKVATSAGVKGGVK